MTRIRIFVLLTAVFLLCSAEAFADHHEHQFSGGHCTVCGAACTHEWVNGTCALCGSRCSHRSWENGFCTNCGKRCDHLEFDNGVCVICGYACSHVDYEGGQCTECGMQCSHPSHNRNTVLCDICRQSVSHVFNGGRCACGAVQELITGALPKSIFEPCYEQGTVQTVSYPATDNAGNPVEKQMQVYLPYNYGTEEAYNVLILVHGYMSNIYQMMSSAERYGSTVFQYRTMYDNMISQRLCKPLIVVTISSDLYEHSASYEKFAEELRYDVLPFLVRNFLTYADSASMEDIAAARKHFGIGGFSNGSRYAYASGMERCYDLFSNFLCLSGCPEIEGCIETLNRPDNRDRKTVCYLDVAGSVDGNRKFSTECFNELKNTAAMQDSGVYQLIIEGGGHDLFTQAGGIYNGLLLMF